MNIDDTGRLILDKLSVKLNPYIPRSNKIYELATDQEILNGSGGTLIVDTECYTNYFLIAFKDIQTKKIIKFEASNTDLFNSKKLSWIMHQYTTIGFNSIKYDLAMIWCSYYNQSPIFLKEVSDTLIFQNIFWREIQKKFNFKIVQTNHIDLIEVCPLKGSLKLYGARLHSQRIQDLPFAPDAILSNEQIAIVSDYCINDLDNTELLFNNLSEQLKLRKQLSIQYRQDLMSKSDAQIAEAIISSEIKQLSGKWPSKPKIEAKSYAYNIPHYMQFRTQQLQNILSIIASTKFETDGAGRLVLPETLKGMKTQIGNAVYRLGLGGLHSSEKNACYKANADYELLDRDVASYYPAVILNQRLFPEHLGEDFLTVYETIVQRRLEAKKAKNGSISECLKIAINGTFGKTGSPYSVLYSPNITIQITLTGQLALLMLIEQMELNGIKVVSANTDGILIYCHKDQKSKYLEIISLWEQLTGFITEETKYKAIYSRDVNAYLAVKDSEFKGKNDYYDPWRGKTGKDRYWKFQKNPDCQICIEAIEQLIMNDIPLEKTINECRDITKFVAVKNVTGGAHFCNNYLGKVVRYYYSKNSLHNIRYIKNNHLVPETEGCSPLMDLPNELPTNIDYQRYIKRAVDMLFDMAYYQRLKQVSFF